MQDRRCDTCTHSHKYKDTETTTNADNPFRIVTTTRPVDRFECRRFPPAVGENVDGGHFEPATWRMWPRMNADDWCGEWKPGADLLEV